MSNSNEECMLNQIIEEASHYLMKRKAPKTLEEWKERKRILRKMLLQAIGLAPMPEKTPINVRIVGRAERDDYYLDNLIYETFPRFYVTANLFIPKKTSFPVPAILNPVGHAMVNGKTTWYATDISAQLAKLGYVSLTYDPVGQGERRIPGNEHNRAFALFMVGSTDLAMMIMDSIRAIDYLCSRPEVNSQKIGMIGLSGGGLNTFYTAAIDERVKIAFPAGFVCSYKQWVKFGGPHCVCNHIPGMFQYAEEFEIAGLIAPRPLMILPSTGDEIFPIAGVRNTYEEAKRIYALYGVEENITLIEAKGGHGYNSPHLESAYGWMERHLKGTSDGSPIPVPKVTPESTINLELLCLKTGLYPSEPETLLTFALRIAENLLANHPLPQTKGEAERRKEIVRQGIIEVFGGWPERNPLEANVVSTTKHKYYDLEKITFSSQELITIPGLLFKPISSDACAPVVVYLGQKGKSSAMSSRVARAIVEDGKAVFAIDYRGIGELSAANTRLEHQAATDAIMLGKPILGRQVWDVIRAIDYLQSRNDIDGEHIGLLGAGISGTVSLFVAALDRRVQLTAIENALLSYRESVLTDLENSLSLYVPNILKVTDLPGVAALIAPRPLMVMNCAPTLSVHRYRKSIEEIGLFYRFLKAEDKFVQYYIRKADQTERKLIEWFKRIQLLYAGSL